MAKAALLTIHGMGRTSCDYNQGLVQQLKGRLGSGYFDLHVGSIYYQDILQHNEERVWESCKDNVRWDGLREFVLYGFGDAAGLEANKSSLKSPYSEAQRRIATELLNAKEAMGGYGPIVIIGVSLGCQVLSCYFWDAMQAAKGLKVSGGIWQDPDAAMQQTIGGSDLSQGDRDFLAGATVQAFITTGCNIPIFVAAHAKQNIIPIKPNDGFAWDNYYDEDDILGWPLAGLSSEYQQVVKDHKISCGDDALSWITKGWNPRSHDLYWEDDAVLDGLTKRLKTALSN